jgi:CheY-like chemotaxis protein
MAGAALPLAAYYYKHGVSRGFEALMSKGTVLVVDDDPIVLEITRERLEGAGYEVHTRDAAIGTTEFIAKNQPDIVLMDVMMPGLSGDRLTELLQRQGRTKGVPVIFHSSKDAGDLDQLVRRVGAVGAIEKTSNDGEFVRQFEHLATLARLRASHST